MKEIISPVETVDGLFHDGDPSTGAEGTVVHAKWLNAMQGAMIDTQTEHKNILAAAGMQPKAEQNNQITEAINSLILQSLKEDSRQSLLKKNNGADIPDKTAFVKNLGLSNTVEQAQNALDKRTGGTISGSLHVTHSVNVGDNDSGLIANGDGSIAFYANNVKTGEWNNARLHWINNIEVSGRLNVSGDANFSKSINTQGNINTWDLKANGSIYDQGQRVYSLKNPPTSANLSQNGWYKDNATGFIYQWGYIESTDVTQNFPLTFPRTCLNVIVSNANAQGDTVDNAFGYPVNNASFYVATKGSIRGNIAGFPVYWSAVGF
ncbi:MAG: gp53-like domain-containing protein [Sodalis sp. (in: enterobacteria)]|uniref:gp53-like domain-containing protein n=1 Tax=Sodalis sp. (in: enterobacteria) TaxID=1898979 RepID=UPI0039E25A57